MKPKAVRFDQPYFNLAQLMTTPKPIKPANKLVVRNKVLGVMQYLGSHPHLTPSERLAQYRKLESLHAIEAIQTIVFKELERAQDADTLHSACELLMHFGQLEVLKEPLWELITSKQFCDETKDAANLILRHLGDSTAPDAYLDYLEDPEGLIDRETDRMIQTAMTHPQALIDLIDFIISLRPEHQEELLETLCEDYKPNTLLNLYIPLLESQPNERISQFVVEQLGDSQAVEALLLLARIAQWPESQLPCPKKHIERAIKKLQLSGVTEESTPDKKNKGAPRSLLSGFEDLKTEAGECYLTLYDGLGNQGLLFSRKHTDAESEGDVAILGVALNDKYGIIDCFGFERLTPPEWNRLIERFHDAGLKVPVSTEFAAFKLKQAEQLNLNQHRRLPYEYRVWETLLQNTDLQPIDFNTFCANLATSERTEYTGHLYEHPDFNHWFIEFGDEEAVSEILQGLFQWTNTLLSEASKMTPEVLESYETIASNLVTALWQTDWKSRILTRLQECAYLLHQQETPTFAVLAASECMTLQNNLDKTTPPSESGFLKQYGRKSVLENLLRLQQHASNSQMQSILDTLKSHWNL